MKYAVEGALDKCIKCGICTANCPVAAKSEAFAGPKHMGSELTRFRLDEKIPLEEQVDYCCNCRNCELNCPSGVKVSLLNAYYKSLWKAKNEKLNVRDNLLGRPALVAKLGTVNVGLTNFMLEKNVIKNIMEKTLGTSKQRAFPSYQKESFVEWFHKRKSVTFPKKVVYFVGCFTNYNIPEVGKSVVQILERNGYEVIVPQQNCCGLPLVTNGYLEEAKKQGQNNLTSIMQYVNKGYKVIASCTSCGLTLKSEYEEIFGLEQARELSPHVYDFNEFIWELFEAGELDTNFGHLEKKIAYHAPCHLKAQGIGSPALEILKLIPGLEVVEIDAGCCGLSGSYGFKKEKYEISMEVGKNLFDRIQEINPDYCITECGTCGLQITHGSGKEIIYPPMLILKAYENMENPAA